MQNRLEQLIKQLPEGMDAALITSDISRRYYTGFPSSAGTILVGKKGCWLIIDSRYYEAACGAVSGCQVVLQDKLYEQLGDLMKRQSIKTLGLESSGVTLRDYLTLQKKWEGIELSFDNRLSDLVERQRQNKSKEELDCIQQAQRIADQTFLHILDYIKAGRSEREIAWEIDSHNYHLGSEHAAFSTIVAAGRNSSKPHAVPSDYRVESGDFITMDYGAVVSGYCSDMTRTVAVGPVDEKQREVYLLVLEAQEKALEAVKAGIPCKQVDRIARELIDSSPYKGCFGHGLGHSLGLEVHEAPNFNPTSQAITEPGLVMSVEPGIYLTGEFGVRIEDIVAVTEDGCHNFVSSPKELIRL